MTKKGKESSFFDPNEKTGALWKKSTWLKGEQNPPFYPRANRRPVEKIHAAKGWTESTLLAYVLSGVHALAKRGMQDFIRHMSG